MVQDLFPQQIKLREATWSCDAGETTCGLQQQRLKLPVLTSVSDSETSSLLFHKGQLFASNWYSCSRMLVRKRNWTQNKSELIDNAEEQKQQLETVVTQPIDTTFL